MANFFGCETGNVNGVGCGLDEMEKDGYPKNGMMKS